RKARCRPQSRTGLGGALNPVSFSLVTLNTWKNEGAYRQRLRRTADEINTLKPDAVALQETFCAPEADADTAQWLAMHCGLHVTQAQVRPKPRLFEGRNVPSTSGMALLCRQPWLSSQALPLPSNAADGGRLAQIVSLPCGPHTVRLANLHLSHLPGAEGAALRARQLQTVLQRLQALGPASATLLCGDFNGALGSADMASFMGEPWRLLDTFALAGHAREATFFDGQGNGQVLDHVLLAPVLSTAMVEVTSAQTVLRCDQPDADGVTASDHSGLWVRLELS
ncbi:MAG: endonuclease/exonuclease/phosphatase family protein, partial [Hydrogenophaga sp.]